MQETAGMPRSALRHRPIHSDKQEWTIGKTRVNRRKQQHEPHTTYGESRTIEKQRANTRISGESKRSHFIKDTHPLIYLSLGMIAMLILWSALNLMIGWFTTLSNDLRYGRPRTFQTDQVVGYHDSSAHLSHFIALNLQRHIEVIEFPGGDVSQAQIYTGPQLYGPNDDLAPVTLTFADVNGDHKLDMIVSVQQARIAFLNDGQKGFRPSRPEEQEQIERAL